MQNVNQEINSRLCPSLACHSAATSGSNCFDKKKKNPIVSMWDSRYGRVWLPLSPVDSLLVLRLCSLIRKYSLVYSHEVDFMIILSSILLREGGRLRQ